MSETKDVTLHIPKAPFAGCTSPERSVANRSLAFYLQCRGFPDRGVWGVGRDTDASNGEVDADELEESGGRTALWSCCAVEAC